MGVNVKEKARGNKKVNRLLAEYAKSAVVLNVLSDPLGHECFRIPPFYRLAYFLEKICLLVIIALAILANIKINIPAHFIVITVFFSILFWALINYVWLCVPAGLLAFMRPGLKKGTWYIGMGHLAWAIYNRSMLRREFILNDLARILRTAFFDRRINTIATTTWLFEPDNIP